jgi:hypothetical protein
MGSFSPVDEEAMDQPFLFCLVPAKLADKLLAPLREHFADDPSVAVIVEQRDHAHEQRPPTPEGRRHWRAPVARRDLLRALPPALHHQARHVQFVQRMEPLGRAYEGATTAELLRATRANDLAAVSEMWWRVSARVRARLRVRLGDDVAEKAAGEVLGHILDQLEGYDEEQSLLAWIDELVDRSAIERAER